MHTASYARFIQFYAEKGVLRELLVCFAGAAKVGGLRRIIGNMGGRSCSEART